MKRYIQHKRSIGYSTTALILLILIILMLCRCTQSSKDAGKDGWLKGTTDEKIDKVANQLRGFDICMMEMNYRYKQYYESAKDSNYQYALYQLDKMKESILKASERRPKRNQSAQWFVTTILTRLQTQIDSSKSVSLPQDFQVLKNGCKSCHAMEKVSFITIEAH